MKILLVEDDAMLHELYNDMLTGAGYEVTAVSDGAEAFAKMKEGGWDLVLLDQMIPSMTGMEVMMKLKNEPPKLSNKKVVFMTNVDNSKELENMAAVSNGYLQKGNLTPEQFLEKVKQLVS